MCFKMQTQLKKEKSEDTCSKEVALKDNRVKCYNSNDV